VQPALRQLLRAAQIHAVRRLLSERGSEQTQGAAGSPAIGAATFAFEVVLIDDRQSTRLKCAERLAWEAGQTGGAAQEPSQIGPGAQNRRSGSWTAQLGTVKPEMPQPACAWAADRAGACCPVHAIDEALLKKDISNFTLKMGSISVATWSKAAVNRSKRWRETSLKAEMAAFEAARASSSSDAWSASLLRIASYCSTACGA